ncbi:glycosyltransferase [Leuconostoc citreum]|uniref:glycosyltransferase n=1 Tax=Leuconostoc citreum TaxID=33964 RepID=UPI0011BB8566|nr:glycosyltransferase [Leuconostoc citreum]QEA45934.1 glycosyltransferase [Leuconostoc citreum]QEA62623.1 glycosyltransferase [Leuconostoc citreum]
MENCKVSVIIPVYQENINFIQQSVQSILNQTYNNIEVLIGLDDPKNLMAIEFLKDLVTKNKNVQLIINEKNLGLAANLNNLIKQSTGEFIARMDADDIAFETRISDQLFFVQKNDLNFLSGAYDSINESGQVIKLGKKNDLLDNKIRTIEKYGNILAHPLWLVRRNILIKLQYRKLEPVEDYDLIARAMLDTNIKFGYIGTPLLKYRVRQNSESHKNPSRSVMMSLEISKFVRRKKTPDINKIIIQKKKSNIKQKIKLIKIMMLIRYKIVRVIVEKF